MVKNTVMLAGHWHMDSMRALIRPRAELAWGGKGEGGVF